MRCGPRRRLGLRVLGPPRGGGRGALPHEHWETALSVCAAPNVRRPRGRSARARSRRRRRGRPRPSTTRWRSASAAASRAGRRSRRVPHRGGDGAARWANVRRRPWTRRPGRRHDRGRRVRGALARDGRACGAAARASGRARRRSAPAAAPGALGRRGGRVRRREGGARRVRGPRGRGRSRLSAPRRRRRARGAGAAHAQARSSTAPRTPRRRARGDGSRRAWPASTPWRRAAARGPGTPESSPRSPRAASGGRRRGGARCAAWSALVLTGGGARRLADRRPALLERTRDLAPRLVARVVWPRGGLADAPEPLDEADDDANAALHGDDAAALPENAGAWTESLEWDAYRRLRDAFLGECLRSTSDALGAARYVEAVLAGARRVDANDADVLAAAARRLALAGRSSRGRLGRRGRVTALSNAVHACVAAAAAPRVRARRGSSPRRRCCRRRAQVALRRRARLTEALRCPALHVVGGAGTPPRGARRAPALLRGDVVRRAAARRGSSRTRRCRRSPRPRGGTAPPDGARAAFTALGAAALAGPRRRRPRHARGGRRRARGAGRGLGGAGAAQGRDLRVVAALVREATRHAPSAAAVAAATLGAVRAPRRPAPATARWRADRPRPSPRPRRRRGAGRARNPRDGAVPTAARCASSARSRTAGRPPEAALAEQQRRRRGRARPSTPRPRLPSCRPSSPPRRRAAGRGRALLTLAAAAAAHPSVLADGALALPARARRRRASCPGTASRRRPFRGVRAPHPRRLCARRRAEAETATGADRRGRVRLAASRPPCGARAPRRPCGRPSDPWGPRSSSTASRRRSASPPLCRAPGSALRARLAPTTSPRSRRRRRSPRPDIAPGSRRAALAREGAAGAASSSPSFPRPRHTTAAARPRGRHGNIRCSPCAYTRSTGVPARSQWRHRRINAVMG